MLLSKEPFIPHTVILVFLEITSWVMKSMLSKWHLQAKWFFLNMHHMLTQLKFSELELEFSMNSFLKKVLVRLLSTLLNKSNIGEEESQEVNSLEEFQLLILDI